MINPKELSTDELYYKSKDYMSVSMYKQMQKCELNAVNGVFKPTDSMLVGSYVDAYISGTLDEFISEHPEIFSSRGATKGQLKSEFKKAEEICSYIDNDKVFSQFMSGEKQTVMTGEINGVPWKIKMDSYSPHIAINDLKCMYTVTNNKGEYVNFVSNWGYDIQMACYQEIVFQNTGERLPVYVCAVTKETPINSVIVNIPQDILDIVLYDVEQLAPRAWSVMQGLVEPEKCGHCATCLSARKTTPIVSLEDLV